MATATAPALTKRQYAALHKTATAAGRAAAEAVTPETMIVTDRSLRKTYVVTDGICGFAWVWFKGNTGFARWAKAQGLTTKGYPTGLTIRVWDYGQSLERKRAHAHAYAETLKAHGIDCHVETYVD